MRRAFRLALGRPDRRFPFPRSAAYLCHRLVQAGVDLYKVQGFLGHKSPIMTQRYAHHYPESLRDGVEMLDEVRGHKFSTVGRITDWRQAM